MENAMMGSECLGLLQRVAHYRGGRMNRSNIDPSVWFRLPVNKDDAPGYFDLIPNPMDFSTIQEKIKSGLYKDMEEFHADMLLIRDNCVKYNRDPASQIRVDCDTVFGFFSVEYDKLKSRRPAKKKAPGTGWDIGTYRRAQKEAKLDMAHASAMKVVHSQVDKLDDDIREKEERIRELTAEIEWKERLRAELVPPLKIDQHVQVELASKVQCVTNPTRVLPNDSGRCYLSNTTMNKRVEETCKVLEPIHGADFKSVQDGLWLTLVKRAGKGAIQKYYSSLSRPKEGRVTKRKERVTEANVVRCVKYMYRNGTISSRKYTSLRQADVNFECSGDELMTYQELIDELKSICAELQVHEVVGLSGCYRNLEDTLLKIASVYLEIDEKLQAHGQSLNWLKKERGHFSISVGADGAPASKLKTHTSVLLSFLNLPEKVNSCMYQFLLFGADVPEDHASILNYVAEIASSMESIEKKEFMIGSTVVRFTLELVPGDCKWIATACGELSNAATYPSSYGNVHKDDLSKLDGSLGGSESSTWKPWAYLDRLAVAKKVALKKQEVDRRDLVTKYIASLHSRQEREPSLGIYSDRCYIDSLHLKNNICAQLHQVILTEALTQTDEKVIRGGIDFKNDAFIKSPFGRYLVCLRDEVRAGRIFIQVRRWFAENCASLSKGSCGTRLLGVRFTGEDSFKFCQDYPLLIKAVGENGTPDRQFRLLVLHFACTVVREAIGLASKIKFSQFELQQLQNVCRQYHACHVLLLTGANLTTWHLGYVVPFHAEVLYYRLGVGLGINSMQGREAKNKQLKEYARFSTPQNKWGMIFRHEYLDLYWLKEHDMDVVVKDLMKRKSRDRYHINPNVKADMCRCGLATEGACRFCNHPTMKLIEETCEKRQISPGIKKAQRDVVW